MAHVLFTSEKELNKIHFPSSRASAQHPTKLLSLSSSCYNLDDIGLQL